MPNATCAQLPRIGQPLMLAWPDLSVRNASKESCSSSAFSVGVLFAKSHPHTRVTERNSPSRMFEHETQAGPQLLHRPEDSRSELPVSRADIYVRIEFGRGFQNQTLGVRQPDRSDDAAHQVVREKECDRKALSKFFRAVFASQGQDACGLHGGVAVADWTAVYFDFRADPNAQRSQFMVLDTEEVVS